MATPSAFMPTSATTSVASAAASSAATPIPTPQQGDSLRLVNNATTMAFLKFGDSTVGPATTADFPMVPNSVETIRLPAAITHFTVILASGTGTMYATKGEGV